MSLRHNASRHSRSSLSITWQLLSATLRTLSGLVHPDPQKANLRVVAVENEIRSVGLQQLAVESRAAEIVGVETEQQAMAAVDAERDRAARRCIDRHQRLNRSQDVAAGIDVAIARSRSHHAS